MHISATTKKSLNFYRKYVWGLKTTKILTTLLVLANILTTLFIALYINNNVVNSTAFLRFNSIMLILIMVPVSTLFIFQTWISFTLNNLTSQNGIDVIFSTVRLTRTKILVIRFFILSMFSLTFVFAITLFNLIFLFISNNAKTEFLMLDASLFIGLFFLIIMFGSFIYFISTIFRGTLSTVILISSIFLLIGFLILGRFLVKPSSKDAITYDLSKNVNNYARIYEVDNNGKIITKHIGTYKNYALTTSDINTAKSIDTIFGDKNDAIMYISPSESIFELFTTLYSKFMHTEYTASEIYQTSTKEEKILSGSILQGHLANGGSPENINVNSNHIVSISYQDISPFDITYDTFRENVFELLDKSFMGNKNKSKATILYSKLIRFQQWGKSNSNFTQVDRDLLQLISGKENALFYYYIKYHSLLINKFKNIFEEIKSRYGQEVYELLNFAWNDEKFKNNLIHLKTIFDNNYTLERFPEFNQINIKKNATPYDLNYFKNDLLHFTKTGVAKVWDPIKNEYKVIEINNILAQGATINNSTQWSDYIDQNKEVANLTSIYDKLKQLQPDLTNKYNFENNVADYYSINYLIDIKSKPWLQNYYWWLILLALSPILFVYLSIKIFNKKEIL